MEMRAILRAVSWVREGGRGGRGRGKDERNGKKRERGREGWKKGGNTEMRGREEWREGESEEGRGRGGGGGRNKVCEARKHLHHSQRTAQLISQFRHGISLGTHTGREREVGQGCGGTKVLGRGTLS